MLIGKVEPFDLTSKKWTVYARRVEQFIKLNGIKEELHVATLVAVVGQPTYELMCKLCAPDNPETKTYKELVNILGDHLEPKRSEIAERHVFRQRTQKLGETVSEFLQALKHLASTCNFGKELEVNLRDQFVSGLCNEDMKTCLFAEPTLTYKRAIELALALEAAERHAQISSSGGAATSSETASEAVHRAEVVQPRPGPSGAAHRPAGAQAAGPVVAAGVAPDGSTAAGGGGGATTRHYSYDLHLKKGHLKLKFKSAQGNPRGQNYTVDSENESECDFYNLRVCGKDDKPYLVRTSEGQVWQSHMDQLLPLRKSGMIKTLIGTSTNVDVTTPNVDSETKTFEGSTVSDSTEDARSSTDSSTDTYISQNEEEEKQTSTDSSEDLICLGPTPAAKVPNFRPKRACVYKGKYYDYDLEK